MEWKGGPTMTRRHNTYEDSAPWEMFAMSLIDRAVRDARRGDTAARQWLETDPAGVMAALDIGQGFLIRALTPTAKQQG